MPNSIPCDRDDCESLMLVARKEARGDGREGMRAVMHVVVNRARRWYGGHSEAIHTAIYAKNQFSSMSVPSDPQFNVPPIIEDDERAALENLAEEVAAGTDPDITNGALYYANLHDAHSPWFATHILGDPANHPEVAKIEHHTFYA